MTKTRLLSFEYEWEPADGVRSPELRATFARLKIACGSEVITQVEDNRSDSSRRSIYVPLYPLAEWCAYNWWFFFWHSRPEALPRTAWSYERRRLQEGQQWLDHHNSRAVGDGFFWPNLTIVPESEADVRLVWNSDAVASDEPLRFSSQGECLVAREDLQTSIAALVESVLTRLTEEGVKRTPLEEEWTDLRSLNEDEAAFCSAAARLGLDPSSVPEAVESLILRADESLRTELLDDFLRTADPDRMTEDLHWVENASGRIDTFQETPRQELVRVDIPEIGPPWEQGRLAASALRSAMDLRPTQRIDPESFLSVLTDPVGDRGLEGIGGLSWERTPVVILGSERPPRSRRFATARSLLRFLRQEDRFLITSAYGPAQKRERAFAAELLAPAAGLREMLGADVKSVGDVDVARISDYFGVQELVVIHQVENNLKIPVQSQLT
jgi:hypothetical protein